MPDDFAAATGVQRYLIFRSGAQNYALPTEEIAEIITVPPVARLPQSPAALLGLANLRGSVIVVASLRGLLGQEAGPTTERAILLAGASQVAVSVDNVDIMVSLDAAQVETRQSELSAHAGERVRGVFQLSPDMSVTKILDIQSLLAAAFTPAMRAGRKASKLQHKQFQAELAVEKPLKLISFEVGGQEYALPMQAIQEIIPLPASMARVPRSEALLLGVVSLQGGMLPLLSLRGLLGLALLETQLETAKIIVALVGDVPVGLLVDRAKSVISAPADRIQPAPAMLVARMGGEARIGSIYREGDRIVSILAVETLFGEEVMARLSRMSPHNLVAPTSKIARASARQFLVFRLGEEEFGLDVAAVDEVAAAPEKFTRLPKTPKFLEGVVNLRGEVLPVINQRRRFDMPEDASLRPRLLVVRSQRHRAGLLVDSISGVLAVPEDDIESPPLLASEKVSLVEGVLNLDASGRIVLLLDPDELLSRAERSLLDNFAARQKQQE